MRNLFYKWIQINKYFDKTFIVIFSISFLIFYGFFLLKIPTDILQHSYAVLKISRGELEMPSSFLYYLILCITTFLGSATVTTKIVPATLLAISVGFKYLISKNIILYECQNKLLLHSGKSNMSLFVNACAFGLIFMFSIPIDYVFGNPNYYIGYIPPNVWHNSTTIFLMPFALLLFWLSYKQLVSPNGKRVALIALLVFLNLAAKPSYFFVWVLTFPCIFAIRHGINFMFIKNMLPVVLGLAYLALQYMSFFVFQHAALYEGRSGVGFGYLEIWSSASPNIALTLAGSVIFPGVCLILYRSIITKEFMIRYALFQYLVALIIFCFLIETGPRKWHGNFFWQCVVCSYMLNLAFLVVLIKNIIPIIQEKNVYIDSIFQFWQIGLKEKVVLFAFFLQFLSGIVYLSRVFIIKSYC
jgi:hypothetical protein